MLISGVMQITFLAREEKAARQAEPKLPSERFTVTIGILQNYLQVQDEAQLPPLWHRWANGTKRQDYNVLTEILQAYARGAEAFSPCAPIASAKLMQDLLNFNFVSETTDDIETGLQPFIIADASSEHRQANLELARQYGMLAAGDHSLLLRDLESLQAKEVKSIPLTYFELERNLGMFGNLLGAVLGSAHTLTTTYRAFWTLLSNSYRQEIQHIVDNKKYIKPAHILRSIQLICYDWFSQCRALLNPTPPEFIPILRTIVLNTYVLPNLPPALYKLAYPRTSTILSSTSQSTSSTGSSSFNTGSIITGSASSGSTVSSLSPPTITTRQKGTHITNLTPDHRLTQLVVPGTKIKDLMGNDAPPVLDNGQQICLSFLLRNGCWSTCKRASTHHHTLNAAEHNRLTAYLTSQMQQLQALATAIVTTSPATSRGALPP
jgi:hypothetical protein